MMKRALLHIMCHGLAVGLIIVAGITGCLYFAPIGFLFEIIFWCYVLSLGRKRREARDMRMRNRTVLVMVGLLVAGVTVGEPELSGTPNELRQHLSALPGQVILSGQAERTVEADRAVVQVSVLTSEHLLRSALEENNRIRTKIVEALAAAGVTADRVHTSRFSSTPVHSSWTGKVKEYRIKSTVRVQAEHEKEIHLMAGLVDAMDEVWLSSLTFEITKKEELTVELLKEAFERVRERRELYEASLGVRLRPRQVGPPPSADRESGAAWHARVRPEMASASSVLANPEVSVVLHALEAKAPEFSQFDEVLFKAEVVVTFDLLPMKGEAPAGLVGGTR